MKLLTSLLLLICAACVQAQSFEPFVIEDIRVDGLQRITPGTVFSYLPVETGDRMDAVRAAEALRALFQTGFFEDVELIKEGDILVIGVIERPAIAILDVEGNQDIKEEELMQGLESMGISVGETFDEILIDRVKQELTRQYNSRGKYNVQVEPKITELTRNRVKILIDIDEGPAAKIRHMNIVGNTVFDDETLIDEWESSTGGLLSFYTSDNQYSREKLSGDLETLRSYYMDRGYVDFSIESSQVTISPDKESIFITVNIREGEVYEISDIAITGDLILDEQALRRLIPIDSGSVYSRKALEQGAENITSLMGNLGYAFANITPAPEIDRDNNTVKVTYLIDPGKRVYVRRIEFRGNLNTKDEVLRREMRQFEGGWLSQLAVERSRLRLQRLGYFEDVTIETPEVPGTDDQVDVVVTVEERNAGAFQFGLGYSQTAGVIGQVSLTQENFLGTGKSVGINLQNSSIIKQFDINYQNPYWSDDGVSRGFRLSYRESDLGESNIVTYSSDNIAAYMNFGVPITETDRVNLRFGWDSTELVGFPAISSDPRLDDLLRPNRFEAFRAELGWARDSRNHFFLPTQGSIQRLAMEVALPASDQTYYKLNYSNTTFLPVGNNGWAIALSAEIGYGDGYGDTDTLPFYENFYSGGVRSVRGYDDNTLGPRECLFTAAERGLTADSPDLHPDFVLWQQTRDCVDTTGDQSNNSRVGNPLGGAVLVGGSAELVFPAPFAQDTVRLAIFVDAGTVFESLDWVESDEIRTSAGFAVKWQTPMAPIVINFSKALNADEFDETETIQFTYGTTF